MNTASAPNRLILAPADAVAMGACDAQAAELVQLRFFAGLSQQQAADVLGVSRRTADRTWAYARAWLFEQIADERGPEPQGS